MNNKVDNESGSKVTEKVKKFYKICLNLEIQNIIQNYNLHVI